MEEQNVEKKGKPDESLQSRRKFMSSNLGNALFGAVAAATVTSGGIALGEICHKNLQQNTTNHYNCETTYQDHTEHVNSHTNHDNSYSHTNHCDGESYSDVPAHTDSYGDHDNHSDHNDHCNCT